MMTHKLFTNPVTQSVLGIIVKFLGDKRKDYKRRAKISANISARLFQVHV